MIQRGISPAAGGSGASVPNSQRNLRAEVLDENSVDLNLLIVIETTVCELNCKQEFYNFIFLSWTGTNKVEGVGAATKFYAAPKLERIILK